LIQVRASHNLMSFVSLAQSSNRDSSRTSLEDLYIKDARSSFDVGAMSSYYGHRLGSGRPSSKSVAAIALIVHWLSSTSRTLDQAAGSGMHSTYS